MSVTALKESFVTMSFTRPMGTVTAKFGEVSRIHPKGHSGIDFAVPTGYEITSPFEGIVSSVRDYGSVNLGKSVFIKLENGYQIAFGHLSNNKLVSVGDFVHTGDVIGISGNTGRSTGSHLHFMVFDTKGKAVDPETLWQGYRIGFEYFTNKVIAAFHQITDSITTIGI